METIAWRQSLLIINRNNQIRSDARNHDSRHGQTYREAVLFPGKKDYSRLLFLRQRLLAKHEKRYSRQSLNHTRSVTSTLQLATAHKSNFKIINERCRLQKTRIVNDHGSIFGNFMSLLHHYYHPFFYNVHFTSPYDDVAPVFLQLTSIPARGGHISQHNETHRNNVTNQSRVTRSTDRS